MKAHCLGHVVFYVKDLERSLAFYRDLLGFKEVGRIFKVTRERVRQIEAKAVKKLQHPVRSEKLSGFLRGAA